MDEAINYNEIVIEGVDTKQGIARYGGKAERYMKSLRSFSKTMPALVKPFEEFLDEGTVQAAMTDLHTLKGVAGNLGMNELYQNVATFEESVKNNAPKNDVYLIVADLANKITNSIQEKTAFMQK